MNVSLFIPERINVGYNERRDTYSGKLAYVIYFDEKGVLRKEKSWESWRNKKLGNDIYENKPISGFVLNKKVGGDHGHSWEQRNTYTRVYDPRGFEFEITIPNLLFILQECDCSRGKGLEGEFVYSWDGKDIVLLPVTSQEYQESLEFMKLKEMKVSYKDLIIGGTYLTKYKKNLIYLGKFVYYEHHRWNNNCSIKKSYVFYNVNENEIIAYDNMKELSYCLNSTPIPNYAELVDECLKNEHFGSINNLKIIPYHFKMKDDYIYRDDFDVYNGFSNVLIQKNENEIIEYQIKGYECYRIDNLRSTYYRYFRYGFRKYQLNQVRILTFNSDGTIDIKNQKKTGEIITSDDFFKTIKLIYIEFKINNYKDKEEFFEYGNN